MDNSLSVLDPRRIELRGPRFTRNTRYTYHISIPSVKFSLGWELEANHRASGPIPNGISVHSDGSVNGDSTEYVVIPTLVQSPQYTLGLLKDLVHMPNLNTDTSCGFHVHIAPKGVTLIKRQATQGAVSSQNAHPFLVDEIAFAHNGMIFNDEKFGTYDVDSQSLIHGIKARDFSKYEGPIALVWIEEGLLHAYRHGNPLYRGRMADSTYLASEKEHLVSIGCTNIREVKEGMIYTFHNATRIVTKRVKMNKLGFPSALSAAEKQNGWWNYEDKLENEYPSIASTATVNPLHMADEREDFRTWKDEREEKEELCLNCHAADMVDDECEKCGCARWDFANDLSD